MEHAMNAGTRGAAVSQESPASVIPARQMPLAFLAEGDTAKVVKVSGKEELRHHLNNLGFVEGAEVKAIAGVSGDLIVEVKGAQVAVGRQAASHITVAVS